MRIFFKKYNASVMVCVQFISFKIKQRHSKRAQI